MVLKLLFFFEKMKYCAEKFEKVIVCDFDVLFRPNQFFVVEPFVGTIHGHFRLKVKITSIRIFHRSQVRYGMDFSYTLVESVPHELSVSQDITPCKLPM
jgi:hypothetical protein